MRVLKTYLRYQRGRPTPANISFRITYRCNLKCSFCRFWKIQGITESSTDRIKLLIDDLARLGLPYFNITGGEPCLRPDLEEIAAYSASKGIFTALNTNATMVTEEKAKNLVKYFDTIKISLDGFEHTHDALRGVEGAFRRANIGIQNLVKIKKRKAKIIVHLVANDKNVKEIPEFVKQYTPIVDQVSVMPFFDMIENNIYDSSEFVETWKEVDKTYTLNESEAIITEPEIVEGKNVCDAAVLYYSVLPDGKIICCPHFPLALGNINEERFYDVWKRELREDQKAEIDKCGGCYAKCTTEVSKLMRKTPIQLAMAVPKMIKKHLL